MHVSPQGRALIEQREGRRLAAYRDSRGILTIGVGHTGRMSPPQVAAGMTISEAQCDAFLATDLAPVEAVINANVTVPISQTEFDAMASLGFNIGVAGLARSTVIRCLNLGDVTGAADAFLAWSKPAVLAGRRREERAQFLSRDETIEATATARAVAAARAQTLVRKSVARQRAAKTSTAGSAAAAVAGAGVAVSSAGAHHAHLGLIIFGVVVVGVAIDALAIFLKHQAAATLGANAAQQVAVVRALKPPQAANPTAPSRPVKA